MHMPFFLEIGSVRDVDVLAQEVPHVQQQQSSYSSHSAAARNQSNEDR